MATGCIILKDLKEMIKPFKVDLEHRGKPSRFDTHAITKQLLSDLFIKSSKEKAVKNIAKIVGTTKNPRLSKFSLDLVDLEKGSPQLLELLQKSDDVIGSGIALHLVIESIKGESDKARNKQIPISDIDITPDQDGIASVALARLAPVIGRHIMFTQKKRFANRSPKTIEKAYKDIGLKALKKLEKQGLIIMSEGKTNVINDVIEEGADVTVRRPKLMKTETVTLNLKGLLPKASETELGTITKVLNKQGETKSDAFNAVTKSVKRVYNLVTPSNILLPLDGATEDTDIAVDAIVLTDTSERVVEALTDTPVYTSKAIESFLDQLAEKFADSETSFEKLVDSEFAGSSKTVFGIDHVMTLGSDKRESIFGQNLSKSTPMTDLLNHWKSDLKGAPLHMVYKFVRNARMHVMNTVLNSQTSKLDRGMLTTGEYTLDFSNDKDKAGIENFVAGLMDETGLTLEELKGTVDIISDTDESTTLTDYVNDFETEFVNAPLETQMGFVTSLLEANVLGSGKNFSEAISILGGIKALREGIVSGKITTEYMTKPDGTASGGTIAVTQALGFGKSDRAETVLRRMGILSNPKGLDPLSDMYGILTEELERIDKGSTSKTVAKNANNVGIKDLIESGVFKNLRDLSKPPSMVTVYGQGTVSGRETIGTDIADAIITSNTDSAFEYVKKLLAGNTEFKERLENGSIKDMDSFRTTPNSYDTLRAELSKEGGIGTILYDKVNTLINQNLLKDYSALVSEIYTEISQVAGNRAIKILPAMAHMDMLSINEELTSETLNDYGIPLQKIQEIYSAKDGLITREERAAITTAKVNTIHGMDAAINTLAIDRAMDIFKKTFGYDFKGTLPVHDQDISDARFNAILEIEYVKAFKDVSTSYSIPEQLLNTLKLLDPTNSKVALYEEMIKDTQKTRKELLDKNFDLDSRAVFGFKNPPKLEDIMSESTTEVEAEPEVEIESEPETETIVEEEVETEETTETTETLLDTIREVGKGSAVVRGFIKAVEKGLISTKLSASEFFEFIPSTDTVMIGNTDNRYDEDAELDTQSFAELVEHEIVHSYLVGYSNTKAGQADNNIKYIKAIVKKLGTANMLGMKRMNQLSEKFSTDPEKSKHFERLSYIMNQDSDELKFQEFVAVMKAEPNAAKFIYSVLNNEFGRQEGLTTEQIKKRIEKLKSFIDALWDKVAGVLKQYDANTKGALDNVDIEVDLQSLALAIEAVVSDSMTAKHSNYTAIKLSMINETPFGANSKKVGPSLEGENILGTDKYEYEAYTGDTEYDDFITRQTTRLNAYTYAILTKQYETNGKYFAKQLDKKLVEKFPLYTKTKGLINRTYENSEALQELVHYMSWDNFNDKKAKNDFISKQLNIAQSRTKRDNSGVDELHELLKSYTPLEKETIYRSFSQVPMFHIYKNEGMFDKLLSAKSIDDVIDNLIRSNKKLKTLHTQSKETAELMINGKVSSSSTLYNSKILFTNIESKLSKDYETLVALESIKRVKNGLTMIKRVHADSVLHDKIKDYSLALYNLTINVYEETDTPNSYRDNMVTDKFKSPVKMIAITEADYDKFMYNDNGWRILRKPTKSTLGIVVQDIDDNNMLEGTGTNTSLYSSGVSVSSKLAENLELVENNMVKIPNKEGGSSYKIVLTSREKAVIGLIKDPAQALVRSMSHIESVKESQILRDTLIRESFTRQINSTKADVVNLISDIKEDKIDHPWLIKLNNNIKYADLPKEVRAVYKPITNDMTVSNVKGFKNNVSLVRKDISPWLMGYKSPVVFKDNIVLRKIAKVTKELVSLTKIGMVIVNPVKIAKDAISNNVLLMSKNVPIQKIYSYGKSIAGDIQSLTELRGEYLNAKLVLASDPKNETLRDSLKAIDKRIKTHPLAPALFNGMLTSISTDLVLKDYDTITGLQSDIDKIIGKIVLNNKKEANALGKIIMTASKFGFHGEDILRGLGKGMVKGKFSEAMGQTIIDSADRIKAMKNDDDVVTYLSQFIISPNAETTKLGSAATQLMDIVPKITYYRHLKDLGMSEQLAVEGSLDLFPDYKVNMPKNVKFLSDYGILMFPAFWLRIQNVIVNIATRNAATTATGYGLSQLAGVNVESILSANIVNKFIQGSILNIPEIGFDTFVPSNIFRF